LERGAIVHSINGRTISLVPAVDARELEPLLIQMAEALEASCWCGSMRPDDEPCEACKQLSALEKWLEKK